MRIIESDDDNVQVSCPHVDVILPRGMVEQMPMPHINLSITWYDPESLRGLHTRSYDTGMQMIPQIDRRVSVQSRSRRRISENVRIKQKSIRRTTALHRREYPGKSSDDTHSERRSYRDQGPPERGRYQDQNGRLLDRVENIVEEGIQIKVEDPWMRRTPWWWRAPWWWKTPGDWWHPRYPGGWGPPDPKDLQDP